MRTIHLFTILLLCSTISCNSTKKETDQPGIQSTFFDGSWTYRSLLNNPVDTIQFNDLEFATAIFVLKSSANDSITGELDMGSSGTLAIHGIANRCNSQISNFQLHGTGIPGTQTNGWVYDYYGFIVPKWSQGVNQVDALVGSVVRSADHGSSKAGKVASFYMVRRP